jgi:ribonuclease P protein subunit RPR2
MAARSRSKPIHQVKIAKERIAILFEMAERKVKGDPKLADRYVELARKIGMRYNVRIPPELRKRVCKSCKSYLHPGITSTQKTEKGWLIITCKACGKKNRFSLERAKRRKR